MQVMSLLQRIAPPRLINEWALTGEPFDATTAQAAGCSSCGAGAELDAKVEWLIGRIVDKSPTAIRRGKYAMRAIGSMSFDESIAYTESQIALLALTRTARRASRRSPKSASRCGRGSDSSARKRMSQSNPGASFSFSHDSMKSTVRRSNRRHAWLPHSWTRRYSPTSHRWRMERKDLRFKIRMRHFAYRPIAVNECVPKWVLLPSERNTTPEKYREIVSQISDRFRRNRRTPLVRLGACSAIFAFTRGNRRGSASGKSIPLCQRTGQSPTKSSSRCVRNH